MADRAAFGVDGFAALDFRWFRPRDRFASLAISEGRSKSSNSHGIEKRRVHLLATCSREALGAASPAKYSWTVMSLENLQRAWELLQEAYQAQMEGDYDRAVELYGSSIKSQPTAEAHTFLGWTFHFQGKLDEAIAQCKKAIELDPEFGNPYNDIGAYLIEMRRYDEAISWLERAIEAKRYEPRHFPHFNLGRAYLAKEMYGKARSSFRPPCVSNRAMGLPAKPSTSCAVW